jgi:hypothetical protein
MLFDGWIYRFKKMLDEPTTETLRPLLLGIEIYILIS